MPDFIPDGQFIPDSPSAAYQAALYIHNNFVWILLLVALLAAVIWIGRRFFAQRSALPQNTLVTHPALEKNYWDEKKRHIDKRKIISAAVVVVTFLILHFSQDTSGNPVENIIVSALTGAVVGGFAGALLYGIPAFFKKGLPATARYVGSLSKSFKEGHRQ